MLVRVRWKAHDQWPSNINFLLDDGNIIIPQGNLKFIVVTLLFSENTDGNTQIQDNAFEPDKQTSSNPTQQSSNNHSSSQCNGKFY